MNTREYTIRLELDEFDDSEISIPKDLDNEPINNQLKSIYNLFKHKTAEQRRNFFIGVNADVSFDYFYLYTRDFFNPDNVKAYVKGEVYNHEETRAFEYKKPLDHCLTNFSSFYDFSPLYHKCQNTNCFHSQKRTVITDEDNLSSKEKFDKRFNLQTSSCVPQIFKKKDCNTIIPNDPVYDNIREIGTNLICIKDHVEKIRFTWLMWVKIFWSEIVKIFVLSDDDNREAIKDIKVIGDYDLDLSRKLLQNIIKFCQFLDDKAELSKDHVYKLKTGFFLLIQNIRKNIVDNVIRFTKDYHLDASSFAENTFKRKKIDDIDDDFDKMVKNMRQMT